MATDLGSLRSSIQRWTLLLGVLQITLGCVVGFIPPTAVLWFRGIVMSHIEYTANGVLCACDESDQIQNTATPG